MKITMLFRGAALLASFCAGCNLVPRTVEVVDAETGSPIANASVVVYENRGYLLGSYTTKLGYKTDDGGVARAARAIPFGSSGEVSAMAEGYLPVASREGGDVLLKLIPRKALDGVVSGRGRVGVDDEGNAFGFDFSSGKESYDLDECDFIIEQGWKKGDPWPRVFVQNGCVAMAKSVSDVPWHYLIHQEREAPEIGYKTGLFLSEGLNSDRGMNVYFFVTRDGNHGKALVPMWSSFYATGAYELNFDWVLQSKQGDRRLDCPHPFLLASPYPFTAEKIGLTQQLEDIDWQE